LHRLIQPGTKQLLGAYRLCLCRQPNKAYLHAASLAIQGLAERMQAQILEKGTKHTHID
jgi:hypothetical protein